MSTTKTTVESKTTKKVNANVTKEENEMTEKKANELINGIVNIATTQHKNKVELIQAGVNAAFVSINGTKVPGIIGGSKKEMEANQRCIQLMADNVDSEDPMVIARQCYILTKVMADLEGVSLDDIVKIRNHDYIIDCKLKKVYQDYGTVVIDMVTMYPELEEVKLTKEAIRAILVGELNKLLNTRKEEEGEEEENNTINIETENKLSIVETIKALQALGMKSSWFDINGIKQGHPVCYCGESDLKAFTKIVKDCVENEQSYLDVLCTSAQYNKNNLTPDERVEIEGVACIIDYTKKELWSESGNIMYANLDNIEYELPNEAIKAMLEEKARETIITQNEEREYWDDEEDEYDDEYNCDYCECDDCDNCPCNC